MGFKDYLKNNTFTYKKIKQVIDPEKYEKYVESCKTYHHDKKELRTVFTQKVEFPIFLEELNKFVMANPHTNTCRDIKTRVDKELAGTLFNGMLRESKENNQGFYEILKAMNLPWNPPSIVYNDN
jgi:hypothetical protein